MRGSPRALEYELSGVRSPSRKPFTLHISGEGLPEQCIVKATAKTTAAEVIKAVCVRTRPTGPWPAERYALELHPAGATPCIHVECCILPHGSAEVCGAPSVHSALRDGGVAHFRLIPWKEGTPPPAAPSAGAPQARPPPADAPRTDDGRLPDDAGQAALPGVTLPQRRANPDADVDSEE
eukprot:gene29809-21167_t